MAVNSAFGIAPTLCSLILPLLNSTKVGIDWIPSDAALFGMANLVRPDPDPLHYALYAALLLGYNVVAFRWARRSFQERVRERLERA